MNEVIRAVLNSLFSFTKRFCTHQNHQKHHMTQRHPGQSTKMQISEQVTFLLSDVF